MTVNQIGAPLGDWTGTSWLMEMLKILGVYLAERGISTVISKWFDTLHTLSLDPLVGNRMVAIRLDQNLCVHLSNQLASPEGDKSMVTIDLHHPDSLDEMVLTIRGLQNQHHV